MVAFHKFEMHFYFQLGQKISKKKIFFFQIFIVIFNSNFELYFHFQLDQNIF